MIVEKQMRKIEKQTWVLVQKEICYNSTTVQNFLTYLQQSIP